MGIADELITRGWNQGRYESRAGEVCIAAAACYAATGRSPAEVNCCVPDELDGKWRAACDAIASVITRRNHDSITGWNDDPDRTFDEVLRAAKEADEILDAQCE